MKFQFPKCDMKLKRWVAEECLYEDGGPFMGKSKDILCFSWLLLCHFELWSKYSFDSFAVLILFIFDKCLLVQIELDQIVAFLSISSPKRFVK